METQQPPGQWDFPPPPATPPQAMTNVELRVGKRLLWVDGAAYPLRNIARVYTFTLHPKRKEAVLRFLKHAGITLAVAIGLSIIGSVTFMASRSAGSGLLTFVWLGSGAALIYFLVDMLSVLTAQSHYVLAIETAGPSTAMVTSRNPQHLDQLVGYVAGALENPDTEFQVTVERLTISSPANYYFGDNVNMYGGSGNVGIAA
ncbi:DUF6232 family protein [Streptomyces caelestis]|uniref:Uncharacterized protein n=1 Tax=Streptomyces caelestis TaxID=36816 RepID=A0A7W9H6M9_9ACTN|nr:DUF6232 family protein [Streptomyces caelestis]MBB5796713.1 hypothetical protein [Streptomyces caelestis]GGW33135.1 hypothetical protein GCM10010320_10050 [Streptomyces caelestis]